ncbi:MAG: hypothetical protein U1E14_00305 [Geminicoccaceae bacterium]
MRHVSVRHRAIAALEAAASAVRPGVPRPRPGYLPDWQDNLLPDLDPASFTADVALGDGGELAVDPRNGVCKFQAVHSSAALCVNVFAPLRSTPEALTLPGMTGAISLSFERQLPMWPGNGHGRGRAPNLDLVVEAAGSAIAVESKCIEYLDPAKPASFRPSYATELPPEARASAWFAVMQRLIAEPVAYRHLNAAQLVKHAFGMIHSLGQPRRTLLYLYWEPRDAADHPVFAEHRAEIDRFADLVRDDAAVTFEAMSYPELWASWDAAGSNFLPAHVAALRRRYDVALV